MPTTRSIGVPGDRLNFIDKDMVPLENIVDELLPLLGYYKRERKPDESLGDFCHRKSADDLKQFDEAWTARANAAEGT